MDAIVASDDMSRVAAPPHPGLGPRQFVVLLAALMAANNLALELMLPALGHMAHVFGLSAPNQRHWLLTAGLFGYGGGHLVYGTLADRFGRRRVLMLALGIYIAASLAAALAQTFDAILAARVMQGIGAAGARVVVISVLRDCYKGWRMARVLSLGYMVFLAVPVFAPAVGQVIVTEAGWRAVFVAIAAFGTLVLAWLALRLPETLHPRDRRRIAPGEIAAAARITLGNRLSFGYTLAVMAGMGAFVGLIDSAQPIFVDMFHRPRAFTVVFGCISVGTAAASWINARLVERLGERLIAHASLAGFTAIAALHAGIAWLGPEPMLGFVLLQAAMMFCWGLMMANFNAMAMETQGHIAGAASSIQGFIVTVGAASIGAAIAAPFAGTLVPLTVGSTLCGLAGLGAVLYAEGGQLFQLRDSRPFLKV
jgi:DHA1 family bicyclomycin/chloramphenicol resistance-like MFS transporter